MDAFKLAYVSCFMFILLACQQIDILVLETWDLEFPISVITAKQLAFSDNIVLRKFILRKTNLLLQKPLSKFGIGLMAYLCLHCYPITNFDFYGFVKSLYLLLLHQY